MRHFERVSRGRENKLRGGVEEGEVGVGFIVDGDNFEIGGPAGRRSICLPSSTALPRSHQPLLLLVKADFT